MVKIDMPANSWLESAKADFATGGFWNGAYMISLIIRGGGSVDNTFLADLLVKISKVELPARKIVRISGSFDPMDTSIEKLVNMLISYKYHVQVVVRDVPPLAWMYFANWIIFRTSNSTVPVAFDELWYEPPEVGEIAEPMLPKPRLAPDGVRDQFLYLKRAGTVATMTKFVCQSKHNWQLV